MALEMGMAQYGLMAPSAGLKDMFESVRVPDATISRYEMLWYDILAILRLSRCMQAAVQLPVCLTKTRSLMRRMFWSMIGIPLTRMPEVCDSHLLPPMELGRKVLHIKGHSVLGSEMRPQRAGHLLYLDG